MEENKMIANYYSNIVSINSGMYDFEMSFGRKKIREAKVNDEDFDISVLMSPQHAKSFLCILKDHVDIYEKEFGEIVIDIKENR